MRTGGTSGACSGSATGRPGIAVPLGFGPLSHYNSAGPPLLKNQPLPAPPDRETRKNSRKSEKLAVRSETRENSRRGVALCFSLVCSAQCLVIVNSATPSHQGLPTTGIYVAPPGHPLRGVAGPSPPSPTTEAAVCVGAPVSSCVSAAPRPAPSSTGTPSLRRGLPPTDCGRCESRGPCAAWLLEFAEANSSQSPAPPRSARSRRVCL